MGWTEQIPRIEEIGGIKTLIVNGKPFIMTAGEVHNSSSASLSYMEERVWPYVKNLNLNTLFVPVMWEQMEPKQGCYDFSLVQGLVEQARVQKMHLVILWFGLWKNGESDYVPAWVKRDTKTYFRARDKFGQSLNHVSPFCAQAVEADAGAFTALMGFLRDFDGEYGTVLMVQVENEVGLLGASRDFCEKSESYFTSNTPQEIGEEFGEGTWQQVFGEEAGEQMMAWAYASAVEKIAKCGQEVYPLPLYTNVWLEQYPWRPGTYPSGGPTRRNFRMWKYMAPALFGLEPDIYLPNMVSVMEDYNQPGNPLLIPEARRDVSTVSYGFYAIFHYHSLGYAPFGIEDIGREADPDDNLTKEVLDDLQISSSAYDPKGTAPYLAWCYSLVEEIKELYYRFRGTGRLQCFINNQGNETGTYLKFSQYDILISYEKNERGQPYSCGAVIELDSGEFLMVGCRYQFKILPKVGECQKVGSLRLEKGIHVNGKWIAKRKLNGDEVGIRRLGDKMEEFKIQVYKYS